MATLSKIAQMIRPSATFAITNKAKQMAAQGVDVIGFGVGEPDFDTPDNIKEAAIKAIRSGFTKYTPSSGTDELKAAICRKFKVENGLDYKPSEIIVSCGAKHSIYNMVITLCDPDDEVIIPAPYWVSYPDMAMMAHAKPVFIPTSDKDNFKINAEKLDRAITPRAKLLILNSPSNPTGMVYTEQELRAVVGLAVKRGLFVISDEIYEKCIYDGWKHVSPAGFGPEFKAKVLTVNGLSKAYAMTGWRIGYTAGPEEIIKAAGKAQDHSTSNPVSIAQKAAVEALSGDQSATAKMAAEFDRRRKYIVDRLNKMPGVSCLMPPGAFYVFPNVSKLFGRKLMGVDVKGSVQLVDVLLEKAHIAAVPGAPFGADDYIRFSYATAMDKIVQGMDRMENALRTGLA
ncbi:MAG: pyridoxal phosphate-dependent aminotransferase [Planctomycetes bacterium]|nr:pyridoxal phosphate-dependent aminotransferase [Planctomycetota bacterium]MBM4078321.1 pyridoxal phosphate-dependent aminotransferase [Planctomycetota bacterium]